MSSIIIVIVIVGDVDVGVIVLDGVAVVIIIVSVVFLRFLKSLYIKNNLAYYKAGKWATRLPG